MPRFAANLTMMFNEVGFLDRFGRAAAAGFTAVEYMFPYDFDAHALRDRLEEHRLTQVLHNLPAGNWPAGDRGIACLPNRVDEFKAGVDAAIDYATTLTCAKVNCLAGVVPAGLDPSAARATFVENLRYAAPRLQDAGIKLLIEAVNTRDIPGFFLSHTAQAAEIIDAVGSPNVFLQYDVYHMQIMEGDLATTLRTEMPRIENIQVADPPARNEPGTGEVNFAFLFRLIDQLGYAGWIGCEYKPARATEEGLGWIRPYLT